MQYSVGRYAIVVGGPDVVVEVDVEEVELELVVDVVVDDTEVVEEVLVVVDVSVVIVVDVSAIKYCCVVALEMNVPL